MPTVAVSSQISQAVYLVSIIGLSLMLARPVYGVFAASQERSSLVVASGLSAMFDSMSPGTSIVTSLQSYPGVGLSVSLSGHTITASLGGSPAAVQTRWGLPSETLSPGVEYNFTLTGSEISVRGEPLG